MKYFLLSLLLFSTFLKAQNIEDELSALKQNLKSEKDLKQKAKLAGDISWSYLQISVDSAKVYADLAIIFAEKSKDLFTISQAYNDLANVMYGIGNYPKTIELSNLAIPIKVKINDQKGLASLYNKKANSYVRMNDFENGMKNYLNAHSIFEELKDTLNAIHVSFNISSTYYTMGDDENASKYIEKPIVYFRDKKDYFFLSNALVNEALIYKNTRGLEVTIQKFIESLKYAEMSENNTTKGLIYDNLSSLNLKSNNIDLALNYATKSLEIRSKLGVLTDIEDARMALANCYLAKGDYKLAKINYLKTISIFEKNKTLDNLVPVYLGLSYVYTHFKNQDSTNYYYRKYSKLQDELISQKNRKNATELLVKYETEKKERLLAESKTENLLKEAKIKERTTFLYSALALAFLLGLVGFLVYKQQRLKNTQLVKENELKQALVLIENQNNLQEQRLSISKDLHDNIGSQLTFIISSLDNLKYFEFTKDKLYAKFDSIGTFTRATITDLRDTIWAMNKEAITFEDLKTRTTNFIEAAKTSLLGIRFEFNYPENTDDLTLNSLQGIDVYRIIQEAVNNAVKHAKATEIKVNFEINGKTIEIAIIDNGKGFDQATIEAGNGLNSMEKRAAEINSKLDITSLNPGTRVSLKFELEGNS